MTTDAGYLDASPEIDRRLRSTSKVDLLDDGLVWALNRYVLHPEGLALACDPETGALSILTTAPAIWSYEEKTDLFGREKFRRFLRWHGVRPPEPTS